MNNLYGGTITLLSSTIKKLGITTKFVKLNDEKELRAAIGEKTKLVFAETIANPGVEVLDIEKIASIAHENGLPLIVDNTFATPVLCKPFDFGADIVIHSATKYLDGHAIFIGGVIVDSGNFDWEKMATKAYMNRTQTTMAYLIQKPLAKQPISLKLR